MNINFSSKKIMITGVCGTIGSELIKQLTSFPEFMPLEIIGIDNGESEIFFMDQKYLQFKNIHFFVLDVRDESELIRKMSGIDIVFHCAALKHVVLCERSPELAIQTNIIGVQNIIRAAEINNVSTVIFTSSDKAVNPTNVMGTTKLMGERLMTAANSNKKEKNKTIFASTRFGNVLGSTGSVIPIFYNQIQKGGPITITDFEMTRFIMSTHDAVNLILKSSLVAQGGEVFVTKMPVVRITDLADAMINLLSKKLQCSSVDIEKQVIGAKPGEKFYEELMSEEETRRAIEFDQYYVILPAFVGMYSKVNQYYENQNYNKVDKPYNSNNESKMSIEMIISYLEENNILTSPVEDTLERYWPGDKEQLSHIEK